MSDIALELKNITNEYTSSTVNIDNYLTFTKALSVDYEPLDNQHKKSFPEGPDSTGLPLT